MNQDRQRILTELGMLLTASEGVDAMTETLQPDESIGATLTAALTAEDRCDQCGARAVTAAFRMHALSIPELLLCAHHTAKNRDALVAQGWTIAS